jgi:phosphatidylserine/phosphatidylglycerophosphate/cardiolipin synthase-like enzyme
VHELAAAAAELAAAETPERVTRFAHLLRSERLSADSPAGALQDHLALPSARLPRYIEVLNAAQTVSPADAALALEAAALAIQRAQSEAPGIEVARTGPAAGTFRLRTTGTVSREIIDASERKLLVVGYSVTSSPNDAGFAAQTLAAIRRAAERGVVVTAVLHRDPKNRDALLRSWPAASPVPSIFTWPESPDDVMSKLHAKVIVGDGRDALVTSANLTYHGYEANIELGVRVSGEPARLVEAHFRELIRSEELVVWRGQGD